MKKEIKKELKQKLTAVAMIHLVSLKKSRQQKINKCLERSMSSIAGCYVSLLTKKQQKKMWAAIRPIENSVGQVLPATESKNQLQ